MTRGYRPAALKPRPSVKTPGEALRAVEQKLISVRSIAGADEAWEAYRKRELPADDTCRHSAIISDASRHRITCLTCGQSATIGNINPVHQGFDAGYAAAMKAVAGVVADVQTAALQERAVAERRRMLDIADGAQHLTAGCSECGIVADATLYLADDGDNPKVGRMELIHDKDGGHTPRFYTEEK